MNGNTRESRESGSPAKAVVAAIVAGAGAIIATGSDTLPPWLELALAAVVAGGATYVTPRGARLR